MTDTTELQTHEMTPLDIIKTAITDKEIDPDRLGKFLEIFERLTQAEAKKQFNAAMNATMQELPRVVANRTNEQTGSRYADLETVSEIVTPIALSRGLTLTFGTADSTQPDHIRVTCDVLHNGGYEKPYFCDLPIDDKGIKGTPNKTGVWGSGSTLSYARRYLTLLIFNIAVEREDNDGQDTAYISGQQIEKLNDLLVKADQNLGRFLVWAKADSVDQILASKFSDAVRFLQRKIADRGVAK